MVDKVGVYILKTGGQNAYVAMACCTENVGHVVDLNRQYLGMLEVSHTSIIITSR